MEKSKWVGIEQVKEALKIRSHPDKELYPDGKAGLYIFANCPNLIREIKGYRFQPGSDQPYKKDDHALDELRYYVMSLREKNPGKKVWTPQRKGGVRRAF